MSLLFHSAHMLLAKQVIYERDMSTCNIHISIHVFLCVYTGSITRAGMWGQECRSYLNTVPPGDQTYKLTPNYSWIPSCLLIFETPTLKNVLFKFSIILLRELAMYIFSGDQHFMQSFKLKHEHRYNTVYPECTD